MLDFSNWKFYVLLTEIINESKDFKDKETISLSGIESLSKENNIINPVPLFSELKPYIHSALELPL